MYFATITKNELYTNELQITKVIESNSELFVPLTDFWPEDNLVYPLKKLLFYFM